MSRKGKKKSKPGLSDELLKEQIITTLTNSPEQGFNYRQIARKINITDSSAIQMVSDVLKELTKQGSVQEVSRGKYRLKVSKRLYNRYC